MGSENGKCIVASDATPLHRHDDLSPVPDADLQAKNHAEDAIRENERRILIPHNDGTATVVGPGGAAETSFKRITGKRAETILPFACGVAIAMARDGSVVGVGAPCRQERLPRACSGEDECAGRMDAHTSGMRTLQEQTQRIAQALLRVYEILTVLSARDPDTERVAREVVRLGEDLSDIGLHVCNSAVHSEVLSEGSDRPNS